MSKSMTDRKVTWKGWVALLILVVIFSGALKDADGWLQAFDFQTLTGAFGTIGDAGSFRGTGGVGAKEGFAFTLTLIPIVMLALGFVNVVEYYGGLLAAKILFTPLLRPLLGIPGVTGLAFVSAFNSSDVGAVMTRDLYDRGFIEDHERTIFVSYQYAASATIVNTFSCGAPLLPISLLSVGVIVLLEIVVKIIGANFIRFIVNRARKREARGGMGYVDQASRASG